MEIRYLNTDLDLAGDHDLTPLADALEALGIPPLHVGPSEAGRWCATFETAESLGSPDESIAAMLDAIGRLPADARALWSACDVREFDIGYDCGDGPRGFSNRLSNDTLRRAAEAGATLRITLYPPDRPGAGDAR